MTAVCRCRELRGKSQVEVARIAGVGKSQLSKYESGKELPKLDSLERVLAALDFGHVEFFYTLFLLDRSKDRLPAAPCVSPAAAFDRLLSQLFALHREVVLDLDRRGANLKEEG